MKSILAVFLLLASSAFTSSLAPVESSSVKFFIKNAGITVDGSFTSKVKADIKFNASNYTKASIIAEIDVKSIETGISKRDKHLVGKEYFDAANHPTIRMVSTRVAKSKSGDYIGFFNLTIKGITKEVKMPFKVESKGNSTSFNGYFNIDRRDFKVGGSSFILSDDLRVEVKTTINH